jgi:hypothetical protein
VNHLNCLAAAIVGASLVIAPAAIAVDSTSKTFEQCAVLLPPSKTYSFQLSGTIDRTEGSPVIHGMFTVDDGSNVDRGNEGEAFGRCISALIK